MTKSKKNMIVRVVDSNRPFPAQPLKVEVEFVKEYGPGIAVVKYDGFTEKDGKLLPAYGLLKEGEEYLIIDGCDEIGECVDGHAIFKKGGVIGILDEKGRIENMTGLSTFLSN